MFHFFFCLENKILLEAKEKKHQGTKWGEKKVKSKAVNERTEEKESVQRKAFTISRRCAGKAKIP